MHSNWQTFLLDQQAVLENNCVAHFGDLPTERKETQNGTIMTDLSHFGLIRFDGEDAKTFLQSQLSCDVQTINPQKALYGSYCNPKGRVLASFLLWQQQDSFFMQLPAGLCAAILKRLRMYVLRSKVQLADISDEWIRIGIAGPHVATLMTEITESSVCSSNHPLQVMIHRQICILCLNQYRMELITPVEHAFALWRLLSQQAKPVGTSCWDWLDIQWGIPVILPETQEEFLPQMINLDAIGGISFNKGCYPGQEIVARTQYLGKLKRRMFLAHIATAETIHAGDALYSSDLDNQSSGNIVNVAPAPKGGFDVLAVIQQSSVDTGEIHWQSLQGPVLTIKPLPYRLTSQQAK